VEIVQKRIEMTFKINPKDLPKIKRSLTLLNKKFKSETDTPTFTAFFDKGTGLWKIGCWDFDLYFNNKKLEIHKKIMRKQIQSKLMFFYQVEKSFATLRETKTWAGEKVMVIK
jgi:hypothetical protein